MNPASRWVCLAVRVFFGVSLALSSTATQQAAHGLGGAGRLVVESSSEGAGIFARVVKEQGGA